MNLWTSFIEQPGFFYSTVTLLGLLMGSFINVLAHRLPIMLEREWQAEAREVLGLPEVTHRRLDLCLPASHCPHCGHRIRAWENVPLLSYLALRGRCSACRGRISLRYPLLELGCAGLSLVTAWHWGVSWEALLALPLVWCLLAVSSIDAEHQVLPDVLVLPTLWLGLLLNACGLFVAVTDALWGAALGYLSLWSVYWVFRLITGKDGMGHGDFKLLAMLGAWCGWQVLPITLVLSSLTGALMGLYLLRRRHAPMGTAMPFGPYLAIAGWIAWLWGDEMYTFYLQLLGF